MLQAWVSELEPAIAYDCKGNMIGLTWAEMPIGSEMLIVVNAADFR
jgi:hypothetical protein